MTPQDQRHAPIPTLDVDPYAREALLNPAAWQERLREAGPVVHLPRYDILACGRHREVHAVLGDWRGFVSSRGVGLADLRRDRPWRTPSLLIEADPPAHDRARSALSRVLSPRVVADLKAQLSADAERRVEALCGAGPFDAVADLVRPFVLGVFVDAIGLPASQRETLLAYGAMVFDALGPDNAMRRRSFADARRVSEWIAARCARDALAPHGLGAALYRVADAGQIEEAEAALLVRTLLSAGFDTTVAALASAILQLAADPQALRALALDPALVRPAFEEVLRHASPLRALYRTAATGARIAGWPVPEGTKVLCVLASANRDPREWPDPDRFLIDRRPTRHLAFGVGAHACLGQMLARQEAEALLTAMARRLAAVEMCGAPRWRTGNAVRTLERLPVAFIAGPVASRRGAAGGGAPMRAARQEATWPSTS